MRSAILLVAIAICVAGCSSARPARAPATAPTTAASVAAPSPIPDEPDPRCARFSSAKVGAQLTERGAALVFTTSEDIRTLRRRAADFTLPAPAESVGPRVDNIHQGVRFVFEAAPSGDVTALREEVVEQARRIAKGCGLVLTAPSDKTRARSERDASHARRAEPASEQAGPKRKTNGGATQHEPARDKAGSRKAATPVSKAEPKPKPKPAEKRSGSDKPAAPNKPKEDRKPNEDKKPKLPRLPGIHPDPIAPGAE